MSRKPRIGVTGPDRGGWPAWLMTRFAIWRAGGHALRVTPSRPCSIEDLDGLVIGGGADVDPALYGAPLLPQVRAQIRNLDDLGLKSLWLLRALFSARRHQLGDKERDTLETGLIHEAMQRGFPILGICRGLQLLNVSLGGSLHQDISTFYEEAPQLRTVLPRKKIEIEGGSRLHQIFHAAQARVNSLHHQSIDRLGRGLHIAAREPIGIIQAIELGHHDFVIGVQWHPEYLPQDHRQLALFKSLIQAAHKARER